MKKLFVIIALSLSASSLIAEKGHHQHKHHSQIDVTGLEHKPSVKIKLHPDAMSGWNLEVIAENFEFAPMQVNQAHQTGKGHAHLYIDGKKIGRLYSHWRHITGLTPGKHRIKVTLNSNDHQDYSVKGEVVGDQVEISQK